ncbi:MAG: DinB family protein [Candidatus Acidiferrales bacterium]
MAKETVEEYKKRISGLVAGKDPLKIQSTTIAHIERLIQGVSNEKLAKRPAPDKWSITEILAHLSETELVGGYRMRAVLGAPGCTIIGFDQDDWAAAGKYSKRDPHKSLQLFRTLREANLDLLASLDPAQWKHYGNHSERGEESMERIVLMFAGHDLNHISQIEAILGKSASA